MATIQHVSVRFGEGNLNAGLVRQVHYGFKSHSSQCCFMARTLRFLCNHGNHLDTITGLVGVTWHLPGQTVITIVWGATFFTLQATSNGQVTLGKYSDY